MLAIVDIFVLDFVINIGMLSCDNLGMSAFGTLLTYYSTVYVPCFSGGFSSSVETTTWSRVEYVYHVTPLCSLFIMPLHILTHLSKQDGQLSKCRPSY